jgi:hypothetical protein
MALLSGILKKVRKVFGAGRQDKDEIVEILQDAFAQNFLFICDEKSDVTLSKISIDEFENYLAEIKSGFILSGMYASEKPRFTLLFSADFIKQILPVIKEKHSQEVNGDAAAVMKAMDWAKGNIDQLFQIDENPEEIRPLEYFVLKKAYSPGDKEGFLWNISDNSIIKIAAGQLTFFFLMSENTESTLRSNLLNKSFRKAAWEMAQSIFKPVVSPGTQPPAINILRFEKPKEFIAGNALIPQTASFDRFRIKSIFRRMAGSGSNPAKDGLWISASFASGGSEISVHYLIPGVSQKDFAARFGDPNIFFKNLLKDVLIFLKTNFPQLALSFSKLTIDVKPDPAALAGCIQFNGELLVNYSRMGIAVYAPRKYFEAIYPLLLKPWEYRIPVKSARDYLIPLLSLNLSLFAKNVSVFMKKYKGAVAFLPAATSCMPVYELMDLLDNSDLRILIQNFLLPKYSVEIVKLFNIGVMSKKESTGQGKPSVNVLQIAYEKERINPMIPPIAAEEIDRKEKYIKAEEFDSYNKSVLKEIMKAIASGRISVSYKMRYIFVHEINDIINEEDIKRLGDIRSKGIPFSTIKKLPKNRMINFINKIGNPDLCRSLIGSEEENAMLQSCMSRSRRKQFADDFKYIRQQYDNGHLNPEEIIEAKLKINKLLEEEIKNRKAEKAR